MSLWSDYYRAMDGEGPETRYTANLPEPTVSKVARVLMRCGFLMYDPDLRDGSWFVDMKWQWRFWRGPYWAVLARSGRKP